MYLTSTEGKGYDFLPGGIAAANVWARDGAQVQGDGCLEMGAGVVGKRGGSGSICYASVSTDGLDIVGAGMKTDPKGKPRQVRVWDDLSASGTLRGVTGVFAGYDPKASAPGASLAAVQGTSGAAAMFCGTGGTCSSFASADGNTYIRPGTDDGEVVLGSSTGTGVVQVGHSMLPDAHGDVRLRSSQGGAVYIGDTLDAKSPAGVVLGAANGVAGAPATRVTGDSGLEVTGDIHTGGTAYFGGGAAGSPWGLGQGGSNGSLRLSSGSNNIVSFGAGGQVSVGGSEPNTSGALLQVGGLFTALSELRVLPNAATVTAGADPQGAALGVMVDPQGPLVYIASGGSTAETPLIAMRPRDGSASVPGVVTTQGINVSTPVPVGGGAPAGAWVSTSTGGDGQGLKIGMDGDNRGLWSTGTRDVAVYVGGQPRLKVMGDGSGVQVLGNLSVCDPKGVVCTPVVPKQASSVVTPTVTTAILPAVPPQVMGNTYIHPV